MVSSIEILFQRKQEDLKRAEGDLNQLLNEEKVLEQKLKDSKEQLNSDLNSQQLKLMEELNQVGLF